MTAKLLKLSKEPFEISRRNGGARFDLDVHYGPNMVNDNDINFVLVSIVIARTGIVHPRSELRDFRENECFEQRPKITRSRAMRSAVLCSSISDYGCVQIGLCIRPVRKLSLFQLMGRLRDSPQ